MLYLILLLQLYTVYIKNIKIWPIQQLFKVTHHVFSRDCPTPLPTPHPPTPYKIPLLHKICRALAWTRSAKLNKPPVSSRSNA